MKGGIAMRAPVIPGLTVIGLIMLLECGAASAAPDCSDPKHADKPACTDGGDGGSNIADNNITARWAGAVSGTGTTPRECMLDGDPQPNGTHTVYGCVQEPIHTVSVGLSGGVVLDTKGNPTPEDTLTCSTGFAFTAYPNLQYIVAVGGGEICTDGDGCALTVHTAMNGQDALSPYSFIKLVGHGRVGQSTNLNPFACPGPAPDLSINEVEVRVKSGKGSKADLTCLYDVTGTTSFEVTPVCP